MLARLFMYYNVKMIKVYLSFYRYCNTTKIILDPITYQENYLDNNHDRYLQFCFI